MDSLNLVEILLAQKNLFSTWVMISWSLCKKRLFAIFVIYMYHIDMAHYAADTFINEFLNVQFAG